LHLSPQGRKEKKDTHWTLNCITAKVSVGPEHCYPSTASKQYTRQMGSQTTPAGSIQSTTDTTTPAATAARPAAKLPAIQPGKQQLSLFQLRQPIPFHQGLPQPKRSFQGQTSNPNNKGKGKKQMVQVRQGRVNFTTLSELPEGAPIMMGTFSINHQLVIILFDSGGTHSFISSKCGTKIGLDLYATSEAYMIATPGGKISSNQIYRKVPIQLGSNLIKTDLLLLDLEGMDILLGMD
jgi:hypothetical protein